MSCGRYDRRRNCSFYSFVNKEQNSFAELIENMSDLQKEFQEKLKISVTIGIGGIANSLRNVLLIMTEQKIWRTIVSFTEEERFLST